MEHATAHHLWHLLAEGRMSAVEITRRCLARIESLNTRLNAFTHVFGERALARAGAIDARLASGERIEEIGPLAGVPVAVKDNICTGFGLTTCGSRMLSGYASPFSATAVERLERSGAVIVGKTNLDEFAMGSSGEHSWFGPTRNPWDESRVPGGSSSGSAAAVASGMVPVALGSDTGGSVRQPAALCGCVGLKPTYGRVSRWGLVAYGSSLDQIGPLARTVQDAALVYSVIAGHDARDSTCLDRPVEDALGELEAPLTGVRVAVPSAESLEGVQGSVRLVFGLVCRAFERLGATLETVALPGGEALVAAYYLVATAEASSNLSRFDGVRYGHRAAAEPGASLESLYSRSRSEGFGAEVQRRIMLGTHVLRAGYAEQYYVRALKIRRVIRSDYEAIFGVMGCDAVLTPTTPGPAFRFGEKREDPLALYLEDVFTVSANLAGLPAVSVPGGFVPVDGVSLPVGVQLTGPALGEARLLRLARQFERHAGLAGRVAGGAEGSV
jgi:aspartyl-tRNA(Asn)/glutamyl-tRNA(Gln) amidotransferase subunit A